VLNFLKHTGNARVMMMRMTYCKRYCHCERNVSCGVPQVHHWVVLLVFSITFALSCTMFELIIFEIVGVLDSRYYVPYNISHVSDVCQ